LNLLFISFRNVVSPNASFRKKIDALNFIQIPLHKHKSIHNTNQRKSKAPTRPSSAFRPSSTTAKTSRPAHPTSHIEWTTVLLSLRDHGTRFTRFSIKFPLKCRWFYLRNVATGSRRCLSRTEWI